jgi:type IX secretion system PorP/SprF family membrane protein
MKKILIIALSLISFGSLAQQDPLYAQYLMNPLVLNPAYSGLNNNFVASINYRSQWNGIDGQPTTINASAHTSLARNKVGLGVLLTNDRVGNLSSTEANVTAAYKIDLNKSEFSFGMQAGVQTYTTDFSELRIFDANDNAFSAGERGTRLNIGVGAILKSETYFIGLSVPRMLPSSFENSGQQFDLYNQHYYLSAAYLFFRMAEVQIKPSVLFRGVVGAPAAVDVAVNGVLKGKHSIGLFTRNLNTYGVLLRTLMGDRIDIGYAFELPTNRSVGTTFLTHEISLNLNLAVFEYHVDSPGNF